MKNGWYVITGGPCSGKTTTVELLKKRGFETTVEPARHYIDTQRIAGKSVESIRENQLTFQHRVLELQIQTEQALPRDTLVFLDRAIPDALAYYRFLKLPTDDLLASALRIASYTKVFLLDPLPLVNDYARTESEADQKKLHELLGEAYASLRFPIVHVPVLPPEERVEFILQNL